MGVVTGSAVWQGSFREGSGTLSTGGDTLTDVPYTYASRFEGAPGAGPEELLAAAHAGCYNQALANISGLAGTPVAAMTTTAEVTMGRDDRGPAILAVHLRVEASAPGMSEETFQDLAERARVGCAFSKALVLEPTLTATLLPESLAGRAETRFVSGPDGEKFAYRRFGRPGGTPLVLLLRLRGTIDHWDPAFLDALAAHREVIIFDNRGTNLSTGTPPDSVDGLADGAAAFIRALGLSGVDLLGWSLGGMVAVGVALRAPELVRRLVVAGSSPGGVPEMSPMPARVVETIRKPVNDDEDFLYLFFPETEDGRAAGLASLRRLDRRLAGSGAAAGPEAVRAQLTALATNKGYWDRLDEVRQPVLIANGTDDVMIDAYASYAMARRLPHAKLVLYSGAGHGFLFQVIDDFVAEVDTFLT